MNGWSYYFHFAVAVFVIVNPLGAVPVFLSLVGNSPEQDRFRAAFWAAATAAAVLCVSVVAGDRALRLFGIDLPYFQVGGGILLILIAVSMFHARPSRSRSTPEETREAGEQDTVGAVPLGTPLLAGPGAISTAIIYANRASSWLDTLMMVVICLGVSAAAWLVLRVADRLGPMLGRTGVNIVNRLMALILAAMAVRFIAEGVGTIFPGLKASP